MNEEELYNDEFKGFDIICRDCGSKNCTIEWDYDYNYEEELELVGFYIVCHDCGQSDR